MKNNENQQQQNQDGQQQQQNKEQQQQNQSKASFFDSDETFGDDKKGNQNQNQQQNNQQNDAKIKEAETKFNTAKTAYDADPTNVELKTAYENVEKELNTLKNPVKSIFDEIPEVKNVNNDLTNQKQLFTNVAKKLNFKVEGDVGEEDFVKLVNDSIAAATVKVELDKTKYTPEVVEMFDYLEQKGDPRDFLTPLSGIIDFLSLSNEEKVKFVLSNSGLTPDQIKEKMDAFTENKEMDKKANDFTKQALALRDSSMQDVIKKHKDKVNIYSETERQKQERLGKEIVKIVPTMTEFMGEPLTDTTRNYISQEVLNGNFNRTYLNDPKALLNGFLYNKFGPKVFEKMKSSIANASSNAHQAGAESVKQGLHNNNPIEDNSGGSRSAGQGKEKGIGWKDNPDL